MIESFTTDPYGFVVVPSLSGVVPPLDSTQRQAYEERYLFLLFLLRQPSAEIVYVTSEPIQPSVVDYYLGLLPGVVPSQARRRLHLLSRTTGGPAPLSAKLLSARASSTRSARAPVIRTAPTSFPSRRPHSNAIWRSGSACPCTAPTRSSPHSEARAARAGSSRRWVCPTPWAARAWTRSGDVVEALVELLSARLDSRRSFSSTTRACLDWATPSSTWAGSTGQARRVWRSVSWSFVRKIPTRAPSSSSGGSRTSAASSSTLVASEIRSPSVQMRATPLGHVEQLSTHDQLLGGPSGQLS